MPKEAFYAVAVGQIPGIYKTWDECKQQVNQFPNARYKKFPSENLALEFIKENSKSKPRVDANANGFKSKVASAAAPASRPILAPASAAVPSSFSFAKASSVVSKQPARQFTTSTADFKRALRITEDRIVEPASKKLKTGDYSSPGNAGVDLANFDVDEGGYVVVYTDGACTENGRRGAKAGVGVWFNENHPLNMSERVKGRQTNNTAEIQAAHFAITQAKSVGINKLCIKTDSSFLINCITKWVASWKRKGWKLSHGEPVKNREELEQIINVSKDVQIKWSHVRGHRGIHGNEMADQLAVLGAQKPL